jgi:hypothetical protein
MPITVEVKRTETVNYKPRANRAGPARSLFVISTLASSGSVAFTREVLIRPVAAACV